jgi:DNA-directed RNA polymerase specialized sigma24 family protein
MITIYQLSDKQKKYIKLLYEGELNLREMSARLGVHRTTLWRWATDPQIKKCIESHFRRENAKYLRRISDDHQMAQERLDADPDPEHQFTAIKAVLDRTQEQVMGYPPDERGGLSATE